MTLTQAIAELKFKDEQIAELVRQNEEQNRRIEELRQQIALFQRRLYGPRSEKYHPDQLYFDSLLKESQGTEPAEPEPMVSVKATVRRKARPHGRVLFAGEHTAWSNSGMEGAMESGERAALEALRVLA